MSNFQDETESFHREKIRVMEHNVAHLAEVIKSHRQAAAAATDPDERSYYGSAAKRSARARELALDDLADWKVRAEAFKGLSWGVMTDKYIPQGWATSRPIDVSAVDDALDHDRQGGPTHVFRVHLIPDGDGYRAEVIRP
jgi:hypothetical protein